ncbi:hypothetical protein CEE34_05720, partial [Candidatus Aerophobetes bacterium Ae_b3a]
MTKIMKKIKNNEGVYSSVIVMVIIAVTIVVGLSVGYGTTLSYAKEPVTLKFWNDKIGWTSVYEELFKDFTEETGIKVEVTGFYDIEGYIATINTLVGGRDCPDIFTWWSGKTMEGLADTGGLMDVGFAYEANPGVPKSTRDVLTYKGGAWAIPFMGVMTWPIVYDKQSLAEIGAEPPKTWDEFLGVCEKLKTAGITPFANGWASWQGFIFPDEIASRLYPDWYEELNAGEAKYTDPEMKEVFEHFAHEEKGHKDKLLGIKRGKIVFPRQKTIQDLRIADYVVDVEASSDMNYQQALILAMKKEKAAFRLYTNLANMIDDPNLRML